MQEVWAAMRGTDRVGRHRGSNMVDEVKVGSRGRGGRCDLKGKAGREEVQE